MRELQEGLKRCIAQGKEIVHADECCYNQRQMLAHTYAARGRNVVQKVMLPPEPNIAVVGAISTRRGLIC